MRALVLSDIHGNLDALDAVLAAAPPHDAVWNLGDVVGYGASPNEVIDKVREIASIHVRGNHDRVCCGLTATAGFNPVAAAAAEWTLNQLRPENLDWLRNLPQGPIAVGDDGRICCAHGSPLDEDEYILTLRDAWQPLKAASHFVTFFGHTHVQGGFLVGKDGWMDIYPRYKSSQGAQTWTLKLDNADGKAHALINPGSVGQPRDMDWRPAFVLYDDEAAEVQFHRVPYDLKAAQARIIAAHLPRRLADRLAEGR